MKLLKRMPRPAASLAEFMHPQGAPAMEIHDLTVCFGNIVALDKISLQIETGLRVAVVGPNGAGESTLFNVIAGILPASSGELHVHGHSPSRHICIAYVTQSNLVDWNFPVSVWDVVIMGRAGQLGLLRSPSQRDRELVQQSLETV